MNIAKILKDCPKGTKLYSPLFGEVEFIGINSEHIIVKTYKLTEAYFYHNGRYAIGFNNTECLLFPSNDNRDWSTFKLPKKEYEFKPFDKVLVRDANDYPWNIDSSSKYCIEVNNGKIVTCVYYETSRILTFKTRNLSIKFITNFKDLIEIAKPLL